MPGLQNRKVTPLRDLAILDIEDSDTMPFNLSIRKVEAVNAVVDDDRATCERFNDFKLDEGRLAESLKSLDDRIAACDGWCCLSGAIDAVVG